jgi:hypothetical protein
MSLPHPSGGLVRREIKPETVGIIPAGVFDCELLQPL